MTEREYSAHSGLSRGAIQKARKAGRLVVLDHGSIDAAAIDLRRGDKESMVPKNRVRGSCDIAPVHPHNMTVATDVEAVTATNA